MILTRKTPLPTTRALSLAAAPTIILLLNTQVDENFAQKRYNRIKIYQLCIQNQKTIALLGSESEGDYYEESTEGYESGESAYDGAGGYDNYS